MRDAESLDSAIGGEGFDIDLRSNEGAQRVNEKLHLAGAGATAVLSAYDENSERDTFYNAVNTGQEILYIDPQNGRVTHDLRTLSSNTEISSIVYDNKGNRLQFYPERTLRESLTELRNENENTIGLNSPDQQIAQRNLNAAVQADPAQRAQYFTTWLPHVNALTSQPNRPSRQSNCIECAIGFERTLRGIPTVAAEIDPNNPDTPSKVESHYGETFRSSLGTGFAGIARTFTQLQQLGPGHSAIIRVDDQEGWAHAFNAINFGGQVRYIDPQTGWHGEDPRRMNPLINNTIRDTQAMYFDPAGQVVGEPLTMIQNNHQGQQSAQQGQSNSYPQQNPYYSTGAAYLPQLQPQYRSHQASYSSANHYAAGSAHGAPPSTRGRR
ncbi:toxin glutamine deamidase domain-containing protein [Streptomyces sp. NPDC029554]|uniref:toxin glutamine deamidase domain-containing protein n=1 Tax=Streptomyces sp. NPDC029554 TaxID=3155126 RepID=UPI00340E432A